MLEKKAKRSGEEKLIKILRFYKLHFYLFVIKLA